MKRLLLASVLSVSLSSAFAEGGKQDPFVQGDAGAGAARAAACFACHGPNGNGAINPEWPKLAAQHSSYIYAQLNAFKSGHRKNPVMMGQASALSDADMRNLAAFFASQAAVPGVASADAVKIAEKLYRGGDASRSLPACSGCHGPQGVGNAAAAFPRLSGQNSGYVVAQLKAYRSGDRGGSSDDPKVKMMKAVAAQLTDAEIAALGSYVSGLQ
jgi:cytochrome c553